MKITFSLHPMSNMDRIKNILKIINEYPHYTKQTIQSTNTEGINTAKNKIQLSGIVKKYAPNIYNRISGILTRRSK